MHKNRGYSAGQGHIGTARRGNPKSQIRNPKQIPMAKKEENSKRFWRAGPAFGSLGFSSLNLFRIWDFEFRNCHPL
jgi:hypothetical protein